MNYFKIGVLILLLSGLMISCKQAEEKPIPTEEISETESHHSEDELRLNNGKKWTANAETTQGVLAMQEHMDDFRDLENGNYTQLKSQLELEFKTIFEKCTMKGESHEQLHNYLYPIRDYFSALGKDKESAKAAFSKLESYIPVYFEYFE
ncbi:MAG: hypothetical protein WDZ45_10470 [Flavobacteriaceae bacterium]